MDSKEAAPRDVVTITHLSNELYISKNATDAMRRNVQESVRSYSLGQSGAKSEWKEDKGKADYFLPLKNAGIREQSAFLGLLTRSFLSSFPNYDMQGVISWESAQLMTFAERRGVVGKSSVQATPKDTAQPSAPELHKNRYFSVLASRVVPDNVLEFDEFEATPTRHASPGSDAFQSRVPVS